jgi:hypothetical protein
MQIFLLLYYVPSSDEEDESSDIASGSSNAILKPGRLLLSGGLLADWLTPIYRKRVCVWQL